MLNIIILAGRGGVILVSSVAVDYSTLTVGLFAIPFGQNENINKRSGNVLEPNQVDS